MTPQQAAERAARQSYGRLLSWLAWQWRDIAAAEDALGEAFAAALATWPRDGVPASPEGWLVTTAKNQLALAARRRRLAEDPTLTVLWPDAYTPAAEAPAQPDDRLRLMFVCAHPAIDAPIRSALILQTVLGLDAARIGSACLVTADAMGKRLSRAKAKIRQAGIRFEEPEPGELPQRVQAVLEAIYGAYTLQWGLADAAGGGALAGKALYLATLVVAQLPEHVEALGCWRCCRPARHGAMRRTTRRVRSCRSTGRIRVDGMRRSSLRPRCACGARRPCESQGRCRSRRRSSLRM